MNGYACIHELKLTIGQGGQGKGVEKDKRVLYGFVNSGKCTSITFAIKMKVQFSSVQFSPASARRRSGLHSTPIRISPPAPSGRLLWETNSKIVWLRGMNELTGLS